MVLSGQSGCIPAKVVVFGQKWLYSIKGFVFGKSGCILARWFSLGNSCCIRAKVGVFGQKWLYSGKVVVFWGKVVIFGQSCCIRAKMVEFG